MVYLMPNQGSGCLAEESKTRAANLFDHLILRPMRGKAWHNCSRIWRNGKSWDQLPDSEIEAIIKFVAAEQVDSDLGAIVQSSHLQVSLVLILVVSACAPKPLVSPLVSPLVTAPSPILRPTISLNRQRPLDPNINSIAATYPHPAAHVNSDTHTDHHPSDSPRYG